MAVAVRVGPVWTVPHFRVGFPLPCFGAGDSHRVLDKTCSLYQSQPIVRVLSFIFLLLVAHAGAVLSSGLLVRVWQSQDGLPGNVVRSVVQASDGYLWVATAEGVARFDGFDFEVIEPEGEQRRYRFAFSRLFASTGGDIWAATYQGGLFHVRNGRLHQVLSNLRRPNPPLVTQLIEGPDGVVFFKRGQTFSQVSADGKVSAVPSTDDLLRRFDEDLRKQLAGGRVVDPEGRPVLHAQAGGVWTCPPEGGLTVSREGGETSLVELPQGGSVFPVNELVEDNEGDVWVASRGKGLIRVCRPRVDVLDTNQDQNERAVSALTQDHTGAWWIANGRGGLIYWTPDESRFVPLTTNRPVSALFEDQTSRLWAASRDGSVFRYDDGVFKPQFVKTQVPSKVRSIIQDAKATIWFGGTRGLTSLTGDVIRQFGPADGVGELDLTVLQPFPGSRVIVGSSSGKILLGSEGGFRTVATPEEMNRQWISGILVVSENETWVSTLGSGLYLWNGDQWFCFDANDGLPDLRLTCVLGDGRGDLWMGSLGGIIRAVRKDLLGHARNPGAPVKWLRLDHTDGMPSRECIGGFQPAGWQSTDGSLWFPTGGGIARVRPELVKMNTVAPPVYLQSVRANGVRHVGNPGPITTDPGRARFEFRFVGISLSAPDKVTYRARLKGLDDAWRELGSQRVAAYEAVPPGRYTFEVVAINGDGLRSAEPARIPVVIKPHFWETAWFFVTVGGLILLLSTGIGWLIARMRLKKRIQELKVRNVREGERSRIARDLHDDLGASLTEISILAALAAEDAAETSLQPSLDQLSVKAKHVVGSLDEIVWAVNPREDTLRSLVDYIGAFAHEFLDIARIPLRLDVARGIPDIRLATTQRHAVFLAAREALNNIVKHSEATEVMLHFMLADGSLEIRIVDNGRGFSPDYATGGNGLGNLKLRMQEGGGDCRITTKLREGTTVFLTLPLPAAVKPAS